jgi:YHS domain-containing protein
MKNVLSIGLLALLGFAGAAMAEDKKPAKEEPRAKDPVCGMTVDIKTAEKTKYKGKTYYFCSKDEKETFEKTPDKFVGPDKLK